MKTPHILDMPTSFYEQQAPFGFKFSNPVVSPTISRPEDQKPYVAGSYMYGAEKVEDECTDAGKADVAAIMSVSSPLGLPAFLEAVLADIGVEGSIGGANITQTEDAEGVGLTANVVIQFSHRTAGQFSFAAQYVLNETRGFFDDFDFEGDISYSLSMDQQDVTDEVGHAFNGALYITAVMERKS